MSPRRSQRSSVKNFFPLSISNCPVVGQSCSYILAYLGKESIAEKLSQTAVTEIVGVVALYCLKSLFEKRKGFGAVGKKEAEETDQEI